MQVSNILDLYELEKRIELQMRQYDLDEVLLGLRNVPDNVQPFMIAGVSLFALRYARPPVTLKINMQRLAWNHLKKIMELVNNYLLADPISFNPSVTNSYHGSTLIPVIVRIAGNQFSYATDFWGQYARSLKLFRDIPLKIDSLSNTQKFDIKGKFLALNRVSLTDFIDVGFTVYATTFNNAAFVGSYFQEARTQGVVLPGDTAVKNALYLLSADIRLMRDKYEEYKQSNREFAAYDFNPLRVYPVVRPWTQSAIPEFNDAQFIVPLPQLILTRMSEGIYAQMFHKYKSDFAKYFGLLFENYVGEILQNSFSADGILSESEIRQTYKSERGKVPDWIVLENDSATLIECKATGLSQGAVATGDMTLIDFSVGQIIKGLIQLHEFKDACQKRAPGLEKLHDCSELQLLVATYEPFYIINSEPFKETINERLAAKLHSKGIKVSGWSILSVGELEKLQPHIAASINMNTILDELKTKPFNNVLEWCHSQTGKTYQDSFLYEMDVEIYKRLNIPL